MGCLAWGSGVFCLALFMSTQQLLPVVAVWSVTHGHLAWARYTGLKCSPRELPCTCTGLKCNLRGLRCLYYICDSAASCPCVTAPRGNRQKTDDMCRNVARAQMRFPTALVKADAAGGWMLAAHHMTLLDGEMLVDEDLATGATTRRFLAYDCIALGGRSLTHKPWKARTHCTGKATAVLGRACRAHLWMVQPVLVWVPPVHLAKLCKEQALTSVPICR